MTLDCGALTEVALDSVIRAAGRQPGRCGAGTTGAAQTSVLGRARGDLYRGNPVLYVRADRDHRADPYRTTHIRREAHQ